MGRIGGKWLKYLTKIKIKHNDGTELWVKAYSARYGGFWFYSDRWIGPYEIKKRYTYNPINLVLIHAYGDKLSDLVYKANPFLRLVSC